MGTLDRRRFNAPKANRMEKGHTKIGGRKSGAKNLIPASMKEAFKVALTLSGNDTRGKGGMIGYFKRICDDYPELATRMIEKIMPSQMEIIKVSPLDERAMNGLTDEQIEMLKTIYESIGKKPLEAPKVLDIDEDEYAELMIEDDIGDTVH